MLRNYCATTGSALTNTIRRLPNLWPPSTRSLVTRRSSRSAISPIEQTASLARFHAAQRRFLSSTIKEDVFSFNDDDSLSFPLHGTLGESLTVHSNQNVEDRDLMMTAETFLQMDAEFNEQQHNIRTEPQDIITRRHFLRQSLAKEVEANVQTIIQQIESLKVSTIHQQQQEQEQQRKQEQQKQQPSPTEITHNSQRSSIQQVPREKSLSKQWEVAFRREMVAFHRSRSEPGKLNRASSQHATMDEIWDKAIQAAGIGHLVTIPQDSASISNPAKVADVESLITEAKMGLSPIFGLRVHDLGIICEDEIPETIPFDTLPETQNMDQNTQVQEITISTTIPECSSAGSLNAIQSCLALFTVTSKSEWTLLQSNRTVLEKLDSLSGDAITTGEQNGQDLAQEMLEYSRIHRLLLTTEECNLLIARLLSSPTMDVDEILGRCLVFFNEMKRVSATGIEDVGPDGTTYRLLFLALLRRLVATGEAAQICKSMASSSVKLDPQILVDAMKVCQAYGDLGTATKLMTRALDNDTEASLTVQSAGIYLEMLQAKNLMQEALDFYDDIRKSKLLQPGREDEVLFQLCRWPNRSRQGDTNDCTSVLVHVKKAIFDKVETGERPRLQLWFVLLEQLAQAEQLDPSLGNHINQTFRGMLKAYPEAWPGMGLLKIGLRAAQVTMDAGLIASLLARDITRKVAKRQKGRQSSSDDTLLEQAPIPLMVFRKALQIAQRTLDAEAASKILEHYRHVDRDYPSSVKAEVYSLVIKTYAQACKGEMANSLLFSMIGEGIEPTEELIGTVLQSLVSSGKVQDARKLFDAMMEGTQQLPTPNVTSYNAVLVAAIDSHNWDEALSIVDRMKENGVLPNSRTTQGLLLAHVNKYGTERVSALMLRLLAERAPVDQATFTLAFQILHPSLDGKDIDDIRMTARAMGEKEPRLRQVSLKLVRSIRVAETLSAKGRNPQTASPQHESSEPWMTAFADLLEFTHQIDMTRSDHLASQ